MYVHTHTNTRTHRHTLTHTHSPHTHTQHSNCACRPHTQAGRRPLQEEALHFAAGALGRSPQELAVRPSSRPLSRSAPSSQRKEALPARMLRP